MDIISTISIISAISALIIAILTHVKKSSCGSKGFEIITVESKTPTKLDFSIDENKILNPIPIPQK